MFPLIKEDFFAILSFSESLANIVNTLGHEKFISLNNQECIAKPTLINLRPIEYIEGLHYYVFAVNLDRFMRRFNTVNDLSNKVCLPNKTEDLDLSLCNMITGINESKILTRHISCKCKCKFDGRKYNSN